MKNEKILGISVPWFILLTVVIWATAYIGVLPKNMLTGWVFTATLGGLLLWAGGKIPKFDMLGGPSLLCLFIPALFTMWGIFPESFKELVNDFYQGSKFGYIELFVSTLIAGSILTMDRNLLVKAGTRYAVPLLIGVLGTMVLAYLIGAITGFGGKDAIRLIMIPIMGGGIGAGAVPLAQIFSAYGGTYEQVYSTILPAVAMGNIVAILMGALLGFLGRDTQKFGIKHFSGHGSLMQEGGEEFQGKEVKDAEVLDVELMGTGMIVAGALYAIGYIFSKKILTTFHAYAYTIILAAVIKITGIFPKDLEKAAGQWYSFIAKYGLASMMVCTGFCSMSLPDCIAAFSNPAYVIIVIAVAAGSAIFAGFGGLLMKMNFCESGITAGLCMANMGGSGDIAVLGAADRMELMPFAQISSRIGGAIMLIIASLIGPWLVA